MFGFGMSPIDKKILQETQQMLEAFAFDGIDVKPIAQKFFRETKSEMARDNPDTIYSEDIGDRVIKSDKYAAPRRRAGLTDKDILAYWNRPALLVMIGAKVHLEFFPFFAYSIAKSRNIDLVEFARDRRRKFPQYGDPDLWDNNLPVNQVFKVEDADIYPEFIFRVGLWQKEISGAEQARLLVDYTSFNSMVRDLVSKGKV